MKPTSAILCFLAACSPGAVSIDDGTGPTPTDPSTGWTESPWEDPTATGSVPGTTVDPFAGASLKIASPASGSFLAIEETQTFEAELLGADGSALDGSGIDWTSSADAGWSGTGDAFDDDPLDVGVHDITAEVTLPNGDRLAYTAGGVLVQSLYAGTYSGLFTVDGSYNLITFTCSGTGTAVCEPYGENIDGDADCLVSLLGIDLPLSFVFDLANTAGVVDGTAGADLFGLFTYDFPASGTLTPVNEGLVLDFGATVPLIGIDISGSFTAPRVSLDAGL